MSILRSLCLLVLLLLCFAPDRTAAQEAPPAGLSQQQYDGLVEAISRSVVDKLRREGLVVTGAGEVKPVAAESPPSATAGRAGERDAAAEEAARMINRLRAIVSAIPDAGRAVADLPARLASDGPEGRGLGAFLALLAGVVALALGVEVIIRRYAGEWRDRLASKSAEDPGVPSLARLCAIGAVDVAALGLVGAICYGAMGGLFPAGNAQGVFAGAVLGSLFAWRLYMLAFRIVLRPGLPGARLAAVDDKAAAILYREISFVIAAIVVVGAVLRTLLQTGVPSIVVSAGQFVTGFLILALFLRAIHVCREPAAGWFADLGHRPGRVTVGETIGRNWILIAVPFFILLTATRIFGILSLRHSVTAAMILTINVVIALVILETVSDYFTRDRRAADADAPRDRKLKDVVARSVRMAALIAAGTLVAQTWIVDVFGLVDQSGWRDLTRSSIAAATTLFLAYVSWEMVKLATDRHLAKGARGGPSEDGEGGAPSSRLATLAPLARIGLGITIFVVALLVVLSELGVNITPLIAGASVFGLAISFGSQTLVRDVVSGVFYLADDAFRVGEYIDCGKAKGTVEGFTLRSIRLRHQNGMVHTIPFGQLGQITNFSRDWSTVKFNLRFTRDTDFEKLRKIVKKLGQEMLEDPELAQDFLEPLKMQGVADIADNATIVRFKFTVKPGRASFVQRQCIKRMVTLFTANNIQFASAMVAVQTLGGAQADAASAAAASQIIAQAQPQAAAAS